MDEKRLLIRDATPEDIPLIASLADVSFRDTYKEILSPEQLDYMMEWMYSEKSLREQMAGGHHYFIAYQEDTPAAYLSVERQGERLFHLQKIYVLPQFKGRGIGAALFGKAREYALSISPSGCTIELNVNRNNPAYHFYLRMGMRVVRQGDFPIGGGFYMNDYIMGIDLKPVCSSR